MTKKLPNIVLMVLDTVGAKHLSLYGYHRPTTPNLERIARESTVYTRCFAPACWTVPSHASLFTGLYPSQHGAHEGTFRLRDHVPHLVSLLKASGYRTLGISANALVTTVTGLCPDFDEFHDLGWRDRPLLLGHLSSSEEPGSKNLQQLLRQTVNVQEALRLVGRYIRETKRWRETVSTGMAILAQHLTKQCRPSPIDRATPFSRKTVSLTRKILQRPVREPLFLFINLMQAHPDYRPPLRWRRFSRWRDRDVKPIKFFYHCLPSTALNRQMSTYTNLYDDEIRFLDALLGQMWEMYRRSPWFENTLFVITSDHGEHLGEKGHYCHLLSLYNELLWVPLIIHYPKGKATSGPDYRLASLTDVYATILDAIDSPMPRPESSFSLMAKPQREMTVAQIVYPDVWRLSLSHKRRVCQSLGLPFSPPVFALITKDGLKIIENQDGSLEIYDLTEDRAEARNLAPSLPKESLSSHRSLLKTWKSQTGFAEAVSGIATGSPGENVPLT